MDHLSAPGAPVAVASTRLTSADRAPLSKGPERLAVTVVVDTRSLSLTTIANVKLKLLAMRIDLKSGLIWSGLATFEA